MKMRPSRSKLALLPAPFVNTVPGQLLLTQYLRWFAQPWAPNPGATPRFLRKLQARVSTNCDHCGHSLDRPHRHAPVPCQPRTRPQTHRQLHHHNVNNMPMPHVHKPENDQHTVKRRMDTRQMRWERAQKQGQNHKC